MELFKIFGMIALKGQKETEEGLDSVSGKASGIGEKLMKGIGVFAKWGAAATVAAAGVASALVKSAVTAYADYEQLVGGVETLFKESAGKVQDYANKAYVTAGLSANEYMETVTSFSASLLQSLDGDTAAAAEKANLAITDMSDNANKMGTSMESIQNAYQGFAKQNYTMLDNLKLGYGGTKEEMQRLLDDAEKLSGQKFDLSSYGDIVDAIHVVQSEMGITGTTAKEAATTIQGSLGMTKSAWQNLVVGLADDTQNFDMLVQNFVDSASKAGENILPRVEVAIKGVGTLIEKIGPEIAKTVPNIVTTTLPSLLKAGTSMVQALIDGLLKTVPELIPCFLDIINQLLEIITVNLPLIIESAVEIVGAFIGGISDASPEILKMGIKLIQNLVNGLKDGLPNVLSAAINIVSNLVVTLLQNLPQIVQTGLQLIVGLVNGILQAIPQLLEVLPDIITQMVDTILTMIPMIIECGIELLTSLVDALPQIIQTIVAVLPQIISGIISTLLSHIGEIIQAGIDLLVSLVDALPQIIQTITQAMPDIIEGIISALLDHLDEIIKAGVSLFMALITNLPQIIVSISESVPDIVSGIADALDKCLQVMWDAGKKLFDKLWEGMKSVASDIANWAKDFMEDLFVTDVSVKKTGGMSAESGSTKRTLPRKHAKGGVVEKGEIALLEGDGAEAVVPLHQNRMWISRVAQDMKNAIGYQSYADDDVKKLMEAVYAFLQRLPDLIADGMESVDLRLDKREVGRMVRAVKS